ncbi:hypothetical protein L3D22_02800 [Lysobacter soli]|uniref:hypothetical protein n=1 Tax=Lysobacter soli TaxID=453783 RepID=UPI0020A09AC6|nr:hypothetical protein [Lysobacter soli]UTA54796.1 hypothetical protein L3D22_02800 [Lysobacter soli]
MANRERAYSLSGRGIDLGKWKALSFGYFSLGKQRKVTRAPQAIGSLAGDSSLLFGAAGKAWKVPGWRRHSAAQRRPAFAGMTSNFNSNATHQQQQEQRHEATATGSSKAPGRPNNAAARTRTLRPNH